jgi:hypothetical protein
MTFHENASIKPEVMARIDKWPVSQLHLPRKNARKLTEAAGMGRIGEQRGLISCLPSFNLPNSASICLLRSMIPVSAAGRSPPEGT